MDARQSDYYDAINRSTEGGDCGPFIDFMLGEIASALRDGDSARPAGASESAAEYVSNVGVNVGGNVGGTERRVLEILAADGCSTAKKSPPSWGKLSARRNVF